MNKKLVEEDKEYSDYLKGEGGKEIKATLSKVNWNDIRMEDDTIVCGDSWKLYNLKSKDKLYGLCSGLNTVPEEVRRLTFAIVDKHYSKTPEEKQKYDKEINKQIENINRNEKTM